MNFQSISLQDIYAENASAWSLAQNVSLTVGLNNLGIGQDTKHGGHLAVSPGPRPHNKNDFFDEQNLTYAPWLTILIACIATLMSSMTIIGNVFVITAFIIDKNLRKYSNYFILNLSIADLLIGVLIPPYAPFLLYKRNWRLGPSACTVWLVLDYVVGTASVLCIVVISLDRYLLVSRGLTYVSGQKVYKAVMLILAVWSIAFLNYGPAIIFWEMLSGEKTVGEDECQVAFHNNLVYLTSTACVEFFVPLISICGLNLAVYLNIRRRSRGLIRTENPKFMIGGGSSKKSEKPTTSSVGVTTAAAATPAGKDSKSAGFFRASSKKTPDNKPVVPVKTNSKTTANNGATLDSSATDGEQTAMIVRLSPVPKGKQPRPLSVSGSSSAGSTSSLEVTTKSKNEKNEKKSKKSFMLKSGDKKKQHHHHQSKPPAASGEVVPLTEVTSRTKQNPPTGDNNNNNNNNIKEVQETSKSPAVVVTQPNEGSKDLNAVVAASGSTPAAVTPTPASSTAPTVVYASFVPRTPRKPNNTSRTLTKDKKAARSLFILVFVFVICWVSKRSQ
jgi:hypothetical protein